MKKSSLILSAAIAAIMSAQVVSADPLNIGVVNNTGVPFTYQADGSKIDPAGHVHCTKGLCNSTTPNGAQMWFGWTGAWGNHDWVALNYANKEQEIGFNLSVNTVYPDTTYMQVSLSPWEGNFLKCYLNDHVPPNVKVKVASGSKITITCPPNPGPFANTPASAPATENGKPVIFHTHNDSMLDQDNKPVLLRGVVRASLEWAKYGQNLSDQDIANMHTLWSANTIRIDLNQDYWLSSAPETTPGSYKQIVDAMIYEATKNNMAVILDLHWVNGKQDILGDEKSLDFWKSVATKYKNYGTVMFELYNEPFQGGKMTNDFWMNGGKPSTSGDTYVGYQQLYNAVRSTGAQNIVIVNGKNYGFDLSWVNANTGIGIIKDAEGNPGKNIVYGAHPYQSKFTGYPNIEYSDFKTQFDKNFEGIKGQYPIIFTEFGDNDPNDYPTGYNTIYKDVLQYADENQINYTAFNWFVASQYTPVSMPTLISDWDKPTCVNGGCLIQPDMTKIHPGTSFSFDQSLSGKVLTSPNHS